MTTKYCPSCGRPGVAVGLNSVLIETAPIVRRHACGIGGPGSRGGDPVSILTKLKINASAYLFLASVLLFNELEARGMDEILGLIPVVTVP